MSDKINVILNGKTVKGNKGDFILDLARENNIEVPTLCNDPRLDPFSSCFLCVVEVEGMKGHQPSCSTKLSEGMVINTDTPEVHKSRKTALDLILSNHYADCVAPCKETCPAGVDVQGYISLINKGLYSEAVALIKETNPLPAICGRVCVRPCELACRRNLLDEDEAVGIDYLKRYASDYDLASEHKYVPEVKPATGKKIAIIGAGPGGLSAAYFLQQEGHQCDIYEANPNPGGWLRYGIPEYRLPNDLLQKEIDTITEIGANIYCNKKLGDNLVYKELKDEYDAVILTIGSQRGTLLRAKGEDAEGVFSGIDFLRNMEMTGQHYDFSGKTVLVVGGGNTAMDCCRTAVRCGSTDVQIIYRRTEKEMPANPIEIHESKIEGVEYKLLHNPVEVNKDENGKLKSVTLIKMELGEPDASGRRRPIPIEGSEFDLEADYILAAIGQKTDINFLDDINDTIEDGELKANKWGDIDADPLTLQTGVENVFAAGDGVSGPATIIEAIAQAKVASRSCHQYLTGQKIEPEKKEFISRKSNFKEQVSDDYVDRYQKQQREEMPTLPGKDRLNFKEVELGYAGKDVVKHESNRCMECGCTEYFTCDLKEHATTYGAEQDRFAGEFNEHRVDFSHPFIEIDNNKCILCSRCVRICKDVVGADALGLVDRGFGTYVAPSMGGSLTDTTCESCGLCISTCPTGAITENVPFKPGPLKMDSFETIDPFGSEGFTIELHHKSNFYMKATGIPSSVNPDGNIGREAKFGYNVFNDSGRLKKPLLKKNGEFVEIEFDEAFDIIEQKIKAVEPDDNLFMAGSGLSNEELYLIRKFSGAAVKTNNINSYQYLRRGDGYMRSSENNVPLEDLKKAGTIYIINSDIQSSNSVVNFKVFDARNRYGAKVEFLSVKPVPELEHKSDKVTRINTLHAFVRAVNYYLLENNRQNEMFIKDRATGFEKYKAELLNEDFEELAHEAGDENGEALIKTFAENYNNEMNAVLVFSEKNVSSNTATELRNLAVITGKLGKTASGIIALKEGMNSQGIIDMGIHPESGIGLQPTNDKAYQEKLREVWGVSDIPTDGMCLCADVKAGNFKNMFIFREDPIGCAIDKSEIKEWLTAPDFVVVQDLFKTETAEMADLILPATAGFESDGSYTNTQKVVQEFEKQAESKVSKTNIEQYLDLMARFGINGNPSFVDIQSEIFALLPKTSQDKTFNLSVADFDNNRRKYKHGGDILSKKFNDFFEQSFNK
ncbi:MAG: molybdopterin-dependent oxidoreductase [Bacteroidota bacterium]|nr:molybdopterin-dependent oxidoreductase [Bacteroidota bacterium]